MSRNFRIPVKELLGPFLPEGEGERAPGMAWIQASRMLPLISLAFILVVTIAGMIKPAGLFRHAALLVLALAITLAGRPLSQYGMKKIDGMLLHDCDPQAYMRAVYGLALNVQNMKLPKQAVREQACGIYAKNFAMALCYMGRWEEARLLAGRLLNCEPSPAEVLGCYQVLAYCCYNYMELEPMREAVQDMRHAARGIGPKQARTVIENVEQLLAVCRARTEEGAEGAYRALRDMKPVGSAKFYLASRSYSLGKTEMELGMTGEAKKHLEYAASNGGCMYCAVHARELLQEISDGNTKKGTDR